MKESACGESEQSIILEAAKTGDIVTLGKYSKLQIQQTSDSSGCTPLHWAAGCNQIEVVRHLLDTKNPFFNVDISVTSRKAKGRTPLHYCCRNGHLEMVKILLHEFNSNPHAKAKHGVSPFQLAVWQNHLHICQYLAALPNNPVVLSKEVNDFGCNILHWAGICPFHRGNDIVKMASWILSHPNMDVKLTQNQGRTCFHKASWGGHFALVKYLHEVHGMYDDVKDNSGNFAADLADMANTDRHRMIAKYLRRECSRVYASSCKLLGLDVDIVLGLEDEVRNQLVRNSYLQKAKYCHPDKIHHQENNDAKSDENSSTKDFQALKSAYEHLVKGGVDDTQKNPMHSIHLMLEVQKKAEKQTSFEYESHQHNFENDEELKLFKPRLIAVLLEYGEKGIHLSNIPKVWDKVWPGNPLPDIDICNSKNDRKSKQASNRKRKKGQLLKFIEQNCGDIVHVVKDSQTGILIKPKNISRVDITTSLENITVES